MSYDLDDRGSIPGRGFFSSSQHPDRLCGPSNGYLGCSSGGNVAGSAEVKNGETKWDHSGPTHSL
jgi:hypothetical protein